MTEERLPWDSPDIVSPWSEEGKPITIREIEEREFAEIKGWFKDDHFEIPEVAFGEGPVSIRYFEDMYNYYMWHVKGEVTNEQKQVMVGHNKRLLSFLKELGWNEMYEIMYPNPETIS